LIARPSAHHNAAALELAFQTDLVRVDHVGDDVSGQAFIVGQPGHGGDKIGEGAWTIPAGFMTVSFHG
jgi:hypothetical protein